MESTNYNMINLVTNNNIIAQLEKEIGQSYVPGEEFIITMISVQRGLFFFFLVGCLYG